MVFLSLSWVLLEVQSGPRFKLMHPHKPSLSYLYPLHLLSLSLLSPEFLELQETLGHQPSQPRWLTCSLISAVLPLQLA